MKYQLTRLVISIGLGGRNLKAINQVKEHVQGLLKNHVHRRFTITKCRKSNALFKIRKGTPMGLKLTIRGKDIDQFVDYKWDLSYDSNSLFKSFTDHRLLRMERYNPKAPDYGLNFRFIFERMGCRVKYRRIKRLRLKEQIDRETCYELLHKKKT